MFDNLQKKQEEVDDIFASTELTSSDQKSFNQDQMASGQTPLNQTPLSSVPSFSGENKNNFDLGFDEERSKKSSVLKKLFIIIIILGLIGAGAYFVYANILLPGLKNNNIENIVPVDNTNLNNQDLTEQEPEVNVEPTNYQANENVNTGNVEENVETTIGVPVETNTTDVPDTSDMLRNIDSDGDGLNDYNEMYIHMTSPTKVDSEDDGLNDWSEIFIFGTDPINTDSDNDTFLDGTEIENCFNPLASGVINVSVFVDSALFYERYPSVALKCGL